MNVMCKTSIVFSGKIPRKKVPLAMSDNFISCGSYARKNEWQLWTLDGYQVAIYIYTNANTGYHIKCNNITSKQYKNLQNNPDESFICKNCNKCNICD